MIVLDTNIISEFSRKNANKAVTDWLRKQSRLEICTCTPVIAELSFGAQKIVVRDDSDKYIRSLDKVLQEIGEDRIFKFDLGAGKLYGNIRASSEASGNSRSQSVLMIAAICITNGATLATRNTKDFEALDVKLINPFEAV